MHGGAYLACFLLVLGGLAIVYFAITAKDNGMTSRLAGAITGGCLVWLGGVAMLAGNVEPTSPKIVIPALVTLVVAAIAAAVIVDEGREPVRA